jgi:hypothetical protein
MWKPAALLPLSIVPVALLAAAPDVDPVQERRPAPWEQVSEANLKATVEKLVSFGTRASVSTKGAGEAAAWLKSELEKTAKDAAGEMKVEFQEFTDPKLQREKELVPQKNVYAILRGTQRPDEVVVFGAHYDSINMKDKTPDAPAPGANDNASGTAGVLEAARILSRMPHERTLVFACFTGEERGLIGAHHFAQFLKDSGSNVVAMLNNDIVGGAKDADGRPLNESDLRCFSAGPTDSDSRRFARLAKIVVEKRVPGFQVLLQDRKDRKGRGGDHEAFSDLGMTAIRFIETNETLEAQHNANDVVERMHFPYHARVVSADIALVANLASAPAAPLAPELAVDGAKVTVTWKAVEGAKSYVVGVRRGALELERTLASDGTVAKLDVEGDTPISACVTAVDARGNLSLFSPESIWPAPK